jgi:hypothetical protein
MKQQALKCLVLVCLGLAGGCEQKSADAKDKLPASPPSASPSTELLARYHFVGTHQLLASPDLPVVKAIAELPETAELRQQTLRQLVAAQLIALTGDASAATTNRVATLLPLMQEWLAAESFLEARGAPNRPPEITLAVRLDETRASAWKTALSDFVVAARLGTPAEIKPEGLSGWEVRLRHAPNLLRFVNVGSWALIGVGQDELPTLAQAIARGKSGGRPVPEAGTNLLTAELNLPRVAESWGLPAFFKGPAKEWPQVALAVSAAGNNLRTRMGLTYAEPLSWRLEKWNLPTNTIRDPLISFTALQPLAPWLAKSALIRDLGIRPQPNQFFLWAHTDPPMQTFAAVPVTDVTNVLRQAGLKLPASANPALAERNAGRFFYVTNRTQVLWDGLVALLPALHPVVEASGQFVVGTIFPPFPRTNPPPVELLRQFAGRTNLVYYDWEITQTRLNQLRVIASMTESELHRRPAASPAELTRFSPRRPAQKFLTAIVPHLSRKTDHGLEGESITEVTLTSPRELTLVRRAPVGLTALELIGLSWWLESPDFPRFGPASTPGGLPATKPANPR